MVIPGGILPIDLALGVALPVHSHIALNFVSNASRIIYPQTLARSSRVVMHVIIKRKSLFPFFPPLSE